MAWAESVGVTNKKHTIGDAHGPLPNDLKHIEASFSLISTDPLIIVITQNPTSPDLVILVATDDRQMDK